MENVTNEGQNNNQYKQQPINVMGVIGFVLAVVALILSWVPYLGYILWFLGVVFSCIGLARKPRSLAVVGLILSFIGLFLLIILGIIGVAVVMSIFG